MFQEAIEILACFEHFEIGSVAPPWLSVSVAKFGWLLFLSWDSKLASATLYRARLYSPIDKISAINRNIPSTQVQCKNNVTFLTSPDGPVLIEELEVKSFYSKT